MKTTMKSSLAILSIVLANTAFAGKDYRFQPLEQQNCSIHDQNLRETLKSTLHTFFRTNYYDRSAYYLETNLDPNSKDQTDRDSLQFDSLEIFKKHGSAHCVGIAQYFKDELLKNQSDMPAFQIVPSTERPGSAQENMPDYPHVALTTWCKDGYILLDPSMNISEPIYLELGKPYSVDLAFRGIWTFQLDLNHNDEVGPRIRVTADSGNIEKPWDEQKKKNSSYFYPLKETTNPDEAISNPYFFEDKKVMLFKFNLPTESAYRVTVNLKTSRVECLETLPTGEIKEIFMLGFSEYKNNPGRLAELVEASKAYENLRMAKGDLLERITTVLNRHL